MVDTFQLSFRINTICPSNTRQSSPGYLMMGFEINARPINGFVVSTVEQSEEGTGLSVGEYVHGFIPWQEYNVVDAKVRVQSVSYNPHDSRQALNRPRNIHISNRPCERSTPRKPLPRPTWESSG